MPSNAKMCIRDRYCIVCSWLRMTVAMYLKPVRQSKCLTPVSYTHLDLNPEVIFKDATDLVTTESVFDQVNKASELKDIFDRAKDYPTVLDYTAGKIAPALEEEDMIAFRTEDGRYGLMKVKEIDRKNEDVSNNQTISLDVVVEKN